LHYHMKLFPKLKHFAFLSVSGKCNLSLLRAI
jgi:hypothetical protein